MHSNRQIKMLDKLRSVVTINPRQKGRGFTLIELMVTLAVLAILGSLALPSFRSFLVNQQLSSASSDFMVSMLQARAEAMRLGKLVAIFPTNGTSWTSGWYLNTVDNNCAEIGTPFGKAAAPSGVVSIKTANTTQSFAQANPSFVYTAVGFPFTSCASPFYAGSMDGKLAFEAVDTGREKRIIVSKTGRVRVCDPSRETCTGS